ncbi:GNAT family N-acetyltransferase [Salinarimonas sp.]|uniref:GNAT family N-acetyltransferase n=1 Tax=Salinarimonas sp. TaxID=2766526 RepID=UPI0032D9896F
MSAPRPAGPDEAPAVAALVDAAFAAYLPRLGRPPGPMLQDWAANVAAGEVVVVADETGALDALARIVPEPEALLLDTLAVRPDRQGRGLGRALVAVAEDEARRRGLARLRLYTNALMTENVALYTRLGFVETHRGGEPPYQRVFMEKAVPRP